MNFSILLQVALTLVLAIAVPVLSYQTARRPEILELPRIQLYFSATLSQWILALIALAVVALSPLRFTQLGFRAAGWAVFLEWTAALTLTALFAVGLLTWLEKRGWWPDEPELVYRLIPETNREKLWAALLVAPTAAVCEEFLYRGFFLASLERWLHSAALASVGSSLVFGLAHVYQNASGMARAAVLGLVLTLPVIRAGTLFPSMTAHFLIDALALIWLGPRMLRKDHSSTCF